MKKQLCFPASVLASLGLIAVFALATAQPAVSECTQTPLASGLQFPLGIAQSNVGSLIIAEQGVPVPLVGPRAPNTGRLSLVDAAGHRRTLLDGLPSAVNDVNEPSGPAGVFMRGRTLFVAMGVGDVGVAGPVPGTTAVNPNGPSSPLFSSVLSIHLSAAAEATTTGFTLTPADQQALAAGNNVTLNDAIGNRMDIRLVANFPDYTLNPLPMFAGNIRLSNPFDLVVVDDTIYLTDGGQNIVREIDTTTGDFFTLAQFPPIPNPLFGIVPAGGPFLDAVPTGITYFDGQLYATLFRGVPFPPGTSTIEQVDPSTGVHSAFLSGRKTAINFLPLQTDGDLDYLVLQHADAGPFFGTTGSLLRFDTPTSAPSAVANCFVRPTTMLYDKKAHLMYVAQYDGRVYALNIN